MRQNIDIPVPHRRRRGQGGLQGFSSGQNSTARFVEQNVDIPVPGGGLQFSLVLVVSAHPQFRVMSVEKGFFQTFSRVTKSPKSAASPSPRVPARMNSRTLAACAGGAGRGRVRRVLRVQWHFV